jgi:hypothetical protein
MRLDFCTGNFDFCRDGPFNGARQISAAENLSASRLFLGHSFFQKNPANGARNVV